MIVIPMAGMSRRFTEAGYTLPKYMLPLAGGTLFDWSVKSFERYFSTGHFTFVLRDEQGTTAFVRDRLSILGVKNYNLVALDHETAGQADSIQIGIDRLGLDDSEELFIFNIDTLRPRLLLNRRPGSAGGLEVFQSEGTNWSFIEPMEQGSPWVKRCTEKIRISDYCCTGLYYFSKAAYFRQAMALERSSPSASELYVAPLFNHLINSGMKVDWFEVPSAQVLLSGVPQEYAALLEADLSKVF